MNRPRHLLGAAFHYDQYTGYSLNPQEDILVIKLPRREHHENESATTLLNATLQMAVKPPGVTLSGFLP